MSNYHLFSQKVNRICYSGIMISPKLYQLEKEIATIVLEKLEREEITVVRAAQISKYVLHALPDTLTDEQIEKIIPTLDDKFTELAGIVLNHLKDKENLSTNQTVDEAQKLIHENKLQEAINLMNNHIQQKI